MRRVFQIFARLLDKWIEERRSKHGRIYIDAGDHRRGYGKLLVCAAGGQDGSTRQVNERRERRCKDITTPSLLKGTASG